MASTSKNDGLRGFIYSSQSSHRRPAVLVSRSGPDGLWIEIQNEDGALLATSPLRDAGISAPLGSTPRKLTLQDGSVFETDEAEKFDQMAGPAAGKALHAFEAFRPRLLGVVIVCLGAAWVLWRYGLDMMVAVAIAFTPPVVTEKIDEGTLRTIDFAMAKPSKISDADRVKVAEIYQRLVGALPDSEAEEHAFELQFRQVPGAGPNAFALPGGTVIMTDAFVDAFPEPDMLAGVLAHEIGHVVEEHGLKRLYRSLSVYLLIAFIVGDTGPLLEDLVLEGNLLLSLSFSRAQETSADKFGVSLTDRAGFDPSGLAQAFARLGKSFGAREPTTWRSTHPSTSDRIEQIEVFIDSL